MSSPDQNLITGSVQIELLVLFLHEIQKHFLRNCSVNSFINFSMQILSIAEEVEFQKKWFHSFCWTFDCSKKPTNCYYFKVFSIFLFTVLRNHWLDFFIRGLNLKHFLLGRLLGFKSVSFIHCIRILIVQECQKAPNFDKSLHWNSYFSITTGLICSTKIEIGMPLYFDKHWV